MGLIILLIGIAVGLACYLLAIWYKNSAKRKNDVDFITDYIDSVYDNVPWGNRIACFMIGQKAFEHGIPFWEPENSNYRNIPEIVWWSEGWNGAHAESPPTYETAGGERSGLSRYQIPKSISKSDTPPDGMWDPEKKAVVDKLKTQPKSHMGEPDAMQAGAAYVMPQSQGKSP
jgi:hypothetical protein